MTAKQMAAVVLMAFAGLATVAGRQGADRPTWATRDLRAGIIGTDTSHVPQFTKMFASRPEWRIKVVAAYKGGSPDLPISANRLEGFARTISQEHGVELVDSIEALLAKVDVVLLESVDGRPHLAQVTPVLKAGKRVFIDKPLSRRASTTPGGLSSCRNKPARHSSARLRFAIIQTLRDCGRMPASAASLACDARYVLNKIDFHPDLFYYGIHGVEALYAVMGPGCVSLSRRVTHESDVTTCRWRDGRTGVYHGLPKADPARPLLTVTGETGKASTTDAVGYDGIVRVIAEFFQPAGHRWIRPRPSRCSSS